MFEKPFLLFADVAEKGARLGTRIGGSVVGFSAKLARFSTNMALKATRIQARQAARQAARQIRRLQRRPSITTLREFRHGQTSLSFYRSVDRSGQVRDYWSLSRDANGSRKRLAFGHMSELRSIREILWREDVRRHVQSNARAATQARHNAQVQGRPLMARANYNGTAPSQSNGRAQANGRSTNTQSRPQGKPGPREEPGQSRRAKPRDEVQEREPGRQERQKQQPNRQIIERTSERRGPAVSPWFALVAVEAINRDGTLRARVVKSFSSLDDALACRAKNPHLALHNRTYSTPPRRGDVVSVRRTDSPEVARRFEELRAQKQGRAKTHSRSQGQAPKREQTALAVANKPPTQTQRQRHAITR